MNELVEIIRRDHALLHDQVRCGSAELARTIDAHLAFLDEVLGPVTGELDERLRREWATAREALVEARTLVDERSDDDTLLEALRGHATQIEQVVLPRLTSELDEGALIDLTAAALQRHDDEALPPGDPVAMRAEVTARGPDSSRPAGA